MTDPPNIRDVRQNSNWSSQAKASAGKGVQDGSFYNTSRKRSSSATEGTLESKRAKSSSNSQPTLSLLSRLGDAGPAGAITSEPTKQRVASYDVARVSEPDKHPTTGYSIKGAASALRNEEDTIQPISLLTRLNDGPPGANDRIGRGEEGPYQTGRDINARGHCMRL